MTWQQWEQYLASEGYTGLESTDGFYFDGIRLTNPEGEEVKFLGMDYTECFENAKLHIEYQKKVEALLVTNVVDTEAFR